MTIDLAGRVAIVTGAGNGLGRAHAMLLARRGARVVVNDLGGSTDGTGGSLTAAQRVAEEIIAAGGEAIANGASVTDNAAVETMVAEVMAKWGRVDILVNNAGILRDKSFSKMELDNFKAVVDVHLMGAVHCTKAVWEIMRSRNYGRIVMTTSSSGLYGNFGQSNYGAAKMALVGLMNTLAIEGEKNNIRVNCIAPSGATRMLEGLLPQDMLDLLVPEAVSPAVLALVSDDAPTKMVLCAGAGGVEAAHITLTRGVFVGTGNDAPEAILAGLGAIGDRADEMLPASGFDQTHFELAKAGYRPVADKSVANG